LKSIAFVVPEMLPVPPVKGGAVEHWVHEVSQHVAALGVEVTVLSRPADTAGAPNVRYIGLAWGVFGRYFLRLKQSLSQRNPVRYFAKAINVIEYSISVRRALTNLNTDIIYIHNDPVIAALVKRKNNDTLVLHMHNDHLTMPGLGVLCSRALRNVDLVLCVSDYIRDRAIRKFPSCAWKFQTVLNATDPHLFRPYSDSETDSVRKKIGFLRGQFVFLYVGRLTEEKGLHVLIEAFSSISSRYGCARLVISGSSFFADAPKTAYEAMIVDKAAPLGDKIRFTGFLPHSELRLLYSLADCVVVTSVWQEPCALVVLEAMASETCLIATRVGGTPQLVADGKTALLVEPGDVPALVEAMERVMVDSELRHGIAQAARKEVLDHFTYDRLASNICGAFEGLN
jgi:spore coat protein SA